MKIECVAAADDHQVFRDGDTANAFAWQIDFPREGWRGRKRIGKPGDLGIAIFTAPSRPVLTG